MASFANCFPLGLAGAVGLAIAFSTGCRDRSPAARAPAQDSAAAAAAADSTMRSALSAALQGQGKAAIASLRSVDSIALSPRFRSTRTCMLQRLASRQPPPDSISDRFVAGVLADYREYWFRSLLDEHPTAANEAWLLTALNARVASEGGKPAPDLDALEPALQKLVRRHHYHLLLGVTSPLRELMLWKVETERRYDVPLPEGAEPVRVVFMDDFASLGWSGFATCERSHTGGWTKPDALFAVQSAYDTASENFRVSYLAHEAQHFSDNRRFPKL
jgi:hypothetical protein